LTTSFLATNLPTGVAGFDTAAGVEAWFRMRTDIEDRIREAKLGAGLIHLPSGYPETNTVWMWAACCPACCKPSRASTPAQRAAPTATGSAPNCCEPPPA